MSGEAPLVSVIIPVYNDAAGIKRCLAALSEQTYPRQRMEVIVADNGSQDDLETAVAPFASWAHLVREPEPGSYAARNRALLEAKGEVLAFTDADCLPAADWIEQGVAALTTASGIGLVAGRIELFAARPGRPTCVETWELVYSFNQERFVKEFRFGATANVFTTARTMAAVGPFAARLRSGGDREWGQRVHAKGLAVVYAPLAVVRHPARRTFREHGKKQRRILGGMADLGLIRPNFRFRGIPGHAWGAVVNLASRRGEHARRAPTRRAFWCLLAVDAYTEMVRLSELWHLTHDGDRAR